MADTAEKWRITDANPVRDLNGKLDWERCAALHNEIVRRGWVGAGYDLQHLSPTTWWDKYHNDPELPAGSLLPDTVEFLKRALEGDSAVSFPPGRPKPSFFRTVDWFYGPRQIFELAMDLDDTMEHRYLVLYSIPLPYVDGHASGIMFDQHAAQAIYHQDLDDQDQTIEGRGDASAEGSGSYPSSASGRIQWLPLEVLLDSYLDMIDQGKAVALSEEPKAEGDDDEYGGCQEWTDPWIMPSFTEEDLRVSLSQFERLVVAIETRMPPDSLTDTEVQYCYTLDSGLLRPEDFAYRFLAAARRPRFEYIAPGLTFVGGGPQPLSDDEHEDDYEGMQPVLLMRGKEKAVNRPLRLKGFPRGTFIPCGLYLTETERTQPNPYEDGCRLVLPYRVGENGYGRYSDGRFFGEDEPLLEERPGPPSSSNDIYQQGYNQFVPSHDVQLKRVLERWAEHVESGYWKVDAHGVVGGIEKWREADSVEHWQKYQLPIHW